MHIVKYIGIYDMSLAFDVGEEISISSQKNVALRTISTLKTQQQNKQAF